MRSAYLRTENKKQNVFDSESRSDFEFHRAEGHRGDSQRSQRRNEDQLLPEGEPVSILGNTSTGEFGEENTQNSIPEREPRNALGDIDYTSEDCCSQTRLTSE